MPLVVLTWVFTPAETSILVVELPALDLEVADAMQDELEDVSHRGVVDRTGVAFDHPTQNLLFALGVVDVGPASDLRSMISCTMRARSLSARISSWSTSSTRSLSSLTLSCISLSVIGSGIVSV